MRKLFILFLIIPIIAIVGCNLSGDGGLFSGSVTMKLTDAPLTLEGKTVQSVNVTITKVEVSKGTEEEDDTEWITLLEEEKKYDLMKLQDGKWDFLAQDVSLEAGKYNQIRIHVTKENTITFEDDTTAYDLTIPSGTETGVKFNGTFTVVAGGDTEVAVDFDASESVIVTGDGRYIMRPAFRIVEDLEELQDEPVDNAS